MSYTQKKKKKEGKNSTFNPRTIPIISEFWKRVSPNSSRYDWLHIMITENLFQGPTQLFHPLKSYILLHYALWISIPYKGVCTLHLAPSLHDQTFHASSITLRARSLEEPKDSRKSLKIIEQRSWDFGMHQNISDCLFFFPSFATPITEVSPSFTSWSVLKIPCQADTQRRMLPSKKLESPTTISLETLFFLHQNLEDW